ncbi:MAG: hypothetical protein ACO3P1_01005 [Pseudomonadales bacterium]
MSEQYAVVDLGSNSVRLLVAQGESDAHGIRLRVIERIKDKVQLARGLRGGNLHPTSVARTEVCLGRFAQRLRAFDRSRIAVVGTHALRTTIDPEPVLSIARDVLGVPVRVLSGAEEAALIYRGVGRRDPIRPERSRLVVDLGGGSAEFAWGDGYAPQRLASAPVGCVSLTEGFFDARSVQVGFEAARAHLAKTLESLPDLERAADVIGTSGTVESVQTVLAANGWGEDLITRDGLDRLVGGLFEGRWDAESGMLGLAPERVDIFPAGVALLDMIFRRYDLRAMRFVGAALEDGVLDEMVHGPGIGNDPRELTVRGLQHDFRVDQTQATRVQSTALACFDAVASPWSLIGLPSQPDWRDLLRTAAALHEVGLAVGPRGHQRHAAYVLRHADMPGFSRREQDAVTGLVRAHRRVLPGLAHAGFPPQERLILRRLTALLRLAVILERARVEGSAPLVSAGVAMNGSAIAGGRLVARPRAELQAGSEGGLDWLRLVLPKGWRESHQLSAAELALESSQLANSGIRFDVGDR